MTDAELESQRVRLDALAEKWLPLLGMDRWVVKHTYSRDETLPTTNRLSSFDECVAQNQCDWCYQRAHITFDCRLTEEHTDEELEAIYVHECMHALVNELRQPDVDQKDWLDHEEHACEILARAFLRVDKSKK